MNATSTQANSSDAKFSQAEIDAATQQAELDGKTVVVENKSSEKPAEAAVLKDIALLGDKASAKEIAAKINELVARVNELSKVKAPSATQTRDRGPVSTKTMTDDDARKAMTGEFSSLGHKEAAEKLGLSYGQIYSARKGFTFKAIYKEAMQSGKKW